MTIQSILIVGVIIVIALIIVFSKKASVPRANSSTEKDIEEALNSGNKIAAIKHYRYVHGVGLKEAKIAIEEMQNDR